MILLDFIETVFNFIDTFKVTWDEINKDKKRSKKQMQEIKSLANTWKKRAEDIKNVENILKDNWAYLPVDQRKDYIQKTIDLVHHGFNVEYHEDGTRTYYGGYENGLINIYESIYELLLYEYSNMKNDQVSRIRLIISDLKKAFSGENWQEERPSLSMMSRY